MGIYGNIWENHGNIWGYPAWLCQQLAIENRPVEMVNLPIKHGDFP